MIQDIKEILDDMHELERAIKALEAGYEAEGPDLHRRRLRAHLVAVRLYNNRREQLMAELEMASSMMGRVGEILNRDAAS